MGVFGEEIRDWRSWHEKIHSWSISRLKNGWLQDSDKPSPRASNNFAWITCWEDGIKWVLSSCSNCWKVTTILEGLQELTETQAQGNGAWGLDCETENWGR